MTQELKPFKLGSVELGEYWAYDADEVDAVLAEKDAFIKTLGEGQAELACEIERLKTKLEDVQASTNAEIRRLKRALWMHRAITAKLNKEGCKVMREYNPFIGIEEFKWQEVERKCRAKAEQYK